VVTGTGTRGGRYFVTGLRDPLAADPVKMLEGSKLPPEKVTSNWKPYYALAPQFVAARARYVLEPPDTVKFEAREGTLVAAGSAPNRWIEEARARSRAIPGITRYDDSALTDKDAADLQSLSRRIEGRVLLFARGSAELPPAEAVGLHDTAADVKNLAGLAASLGSTVRVEVIGRGDSVGSEDVNLVLSRRRAERIAAALRPEGLGALTLIPTGVGSARPLRPEVTEKDRDLNRSVSFHLVVEDAREKIPARR
jgi:OOP family OmpA-OmpF porin